MKMEINGILCTWIYTLDRNIVRDMDIMLSEATHIPRNAGMKTSEDEVTGILTTPGKMQHEK
jgi:hypothetical protein